MIGVSGQIRELVESSVKQVYELDIFRTWLSSESVQEEDLVLINNSFIYRDKIKTTKNKLYLTLKMREPLPDAAELYISSGIAINSNFKTLRRNSSNLPSLVRLDDAVNTELDSLGWLVLILVGCIDRSQIFRERVNHALFGELCLDPAARDMLCLDQNRIVISRMVDEETLWLKLSRQARANGVVDHDLPDSLIAPLTDALRNLRKNSFLMLRLPDAAGIAGDTLLGSIVDALKVNTGEYHASLMKLGNDLGSDSLEYANMLRIAYNFAGEAVTLIRLLISICDLKPLLLWMTLKEQIQLAEAFRTLPWARLSTKPSLDEYHKTISSARNSSFHHLFPFDRAIEVQLDGVSVVAKRLRLFSEYTPSSKNKNLFEYEDQQLIDLLTEFTRSEEVRVSLEFWQRNLDVMNATVNLLSEICSSLGLLAHNQSN